MENSYKPVLEQMQGLIDSRGLRLVAIPGPTHFSSMGTDVAGIEYQILGSGGKEVRITQTLSCYQKLKTTEEERLELIRRPHFYPLEDLIPSLETSYSLSLRIAYFDNSIKGHPVNTLIAEIWIRSDGSILPLGVLSRNEQIQNLAEQDGYADVFAYILDDLVK